MALGNAPVSYGVFGLARPDLVTLPTGPEILDAVVSAGYEGVDLGAHGLFGTGEHLVRALADRDLGLCGGWLDFPFVGDDQSFERALVEARHVLDDMALVATASGHLPPLPTIADSGSQVRRRLPGRAPTLDDQAWATFVTRLERVLDEVRARGLTPTFHHHAATHIETPDEIDRLLADTTTDLTFDTGHLLLGGGDPVVDLGRWSGRINHVHLKDVDVPLLTAAIGSDDVVRAVWEKRVFCPLGEGDLDLDGVLGAILAAGLDRGWIVVEQDVVLMSDDDLVRAVGDQVANREVLRRWFP